MTNIKFDTHISFGNLLTAMSIVLTLVGHGLYLSNRLGSLETKVDAMWQRFLDARIEAPRDTPYYMTPSAQASEPKKPSSPPQQRAPIRNEENP